MMKKYMTGAEIERALTSDFSCEDCGYVPEPDEYCFERTDQGVMVFTCAGCGGIWSLTAVASPN